MPHVARSVKSENVLSHSMGISKLDAKCGRPLGKPHTSPASLSTLQAAGPHARVALARLSGLLWESERGRFVVAHLRA